MALSATCLSSSAVREARSLFSHGRSVSENLQNVSVAAQKDLPVRDNRSVLSVGVLLCHIRPKERPIKFWAAAD